MRSKRNYVLKKYRIYPYREYTSSSYNVEAPQGTGLNEEIMSEYAITKPKNIDELLTWLSTARQLIIGTSKLRPTPQSIT